MAKSKISSGFFGQLGWIGMQTGKSMIEDYSSNITGFAEDVKTVYNDLKHGKTKVVDAVNDIKANGGKKINDWFYDRSEETDGFNFMDNSDSDFDAGYQIGDSSEETDMDSTPSKVLNEDSMKNIAGGQINAMYHIGAKQAEASMINAASISTTIDKGVASIVTAVNNVNSSIAAIGEKIDMITKVIVTQQEQEDYASEKNTGMFDSSGRVTLGSWWNHMKTQANGGLDMIRQYAPMLLGSPSAILKEIIDFSGFRDKDLGMGVRNIANKFNINENEDRFINRLAAKLKGESINSVGNDINEGFGDIVHNTLGGNMMPKALSKALDNIPIFGEMIKDAIAGNTGLKRSKYLEEASSTSSEYNKETAKFDNMVRTSIVEVIPDYLKIIAKSLTGKEYNVSMTGHVTVQSKEDRQKEIDSLMDYSVGNGGVFSNSLSSNISKSFSAYNSRGKGYNTGGMSSKSIDEAFKAFPLDTARDQFGILAAFYFADKTYQMAAFDNQLNDAFWQWLKENLPHQMAVATGNSDYENNKRWMCEYYVDTVKNQLEGSTSGVFGRNKEIKNFLASINQKADAIIDTNNSAAKIAESFGRGDEFKKLSTETLAKKYKENEETRNAENEIEKLKEELYKQVKAEILASDKVNMSEEDFEKLTHTRGQANALKVQSIKKQVDEEYQRRLKMDERSVKMKDKDNNDVEIKGSLSNIEKQFEKMTTDQSQVRTKSFEMAEDQVLSKIFPKNFGQTVIDLLGDIKKNTDVFNFPTTDTGLNGRKKKRNKRRKRNGSNDISDETLSTTGGGNIPPINLNRIFGGGAGVKEDEETARREKAIDDDSIQAAQLEFQAKMQNDDKLDNNELAAGQQALMGNMKDKARGSKLIQAWRKMAMANKGDDAKKEASGENEGKGGGLLSSIFGGGGGLLGILTNGASTILKGIGSVIVQYVAKPLLNFVMKGFKSGYEDIKSGFSKIFGGGSEAKALQDEEAKKESIIHGIPNKITEFKDALLGFLKNKDKEEAEGDEEEEEEETELPFGNSDDEEEEDDSDNDKDDKEESPTQQNSQQNQNNNNNQTDRNSDEHRNDGLSESASRLADDLRTRQQSQESQISRFFKKLGEIPSKILNVVSTPLKLLGKGIKFAGKQLIGLGKAVLHPIRSIVGGFRKLGEGIGKAKAALGEFGNHLKDSAKDLKEAFNKVKEENGGGIKGSLKAGLAAAGVIKTKIGNKIRGRELTEEERAARIEQKEERKQNLKEGANSILKGILKWIGTIVLSMAAVKSLVSAFMNTMEDAMKSVEKPIGKIVDVIKPLIPKVADIFKKLADGISKVVSSLQGVFEVLVNSVGKILDSLVSGLTPVLECLMKLATPLQVLIEGLMPVVEILLDVGGSLISTFVDLATGIITSLLPIIENFVCPAIQVIAGVVQIIAGGIQSVIGILEYGFGGLLVNVGKIVKFLTHSDTLEKAGEDMQTAGKEAIKSGAEQSTKGKQVIKDVFSGNKAETAEAEADDEEEESSSTPTYDSKLPMLNSSNGSAIDAFGSGDEDASSVNANMSSDDDVSEGSVFDQLGEQIKPIVEIMIPIAKGFNDYILPILQGAWETVKAHPIGQYINNIWTNALKPGLEFLSKILHKQDEIKDEVLIPQLTTEKVDLKNDLEESVAQQKMTQGIIENVGGNILAAQGLQIAAAGQPAAGNMVYQTAAGLSAQGMTTTTSGVQQYVNNNSKQLTGKYFNLSKLYPDDPYEGYSISSSSEPTTGEIPEESVATETTPTTPQVTTQPIPTVTTNTSRYREFYERGGYGSGPSQGSYGSYLNMKERGCGPVALADAANRRGGHVSAGALAGSMASSGTYSTSAGTSVGGFLSTAKSMGMGYQVGGVSAGSLRRASANNPVTLVGSGSGFGTRSGNTHYVNVVGTDRSGGAYVSNPISGRVERRSTNDLVSGSVLGLYGSGDITMIPSVLYDLYGSGDKFSPTITKNILKYASTATLNGQDVGNYLAALYRNWNRYYEYTHPDIEVYYKESLTKDQLTSNDSVANWFKSYLNNESGLSFWSTPEKIYQKIIDDAGEYAWLVTTYKRINEAEAKRIAETSTSYTSDTSATTTDTTTSGTSTTTLNRNKATASDSVITTAEATTWLSRIRGSAAGNAGLSDAIDQAYKEYNQKESAHNKIGSNTYNLNQWWRKCALIYWDNAYWEQAKKNAGHSSMTFAKWYDSLEEANKAPLNTSKGKHWQRFANGLVAGNDPLSADIDTMEAEEEASEYIASNGISSVAATEQAWSLSTNPGGFTGYISTEAKYTPGSSSAEAPATGSSFKDRFKQMLTGLTSIWTNIMNIFSMDDGNETEEAIKDAEEDKKEKKIRSEIGNEEYEQYEDAAYQAYVKANPQAQGESDETYQTRLKNGWTDKVKQKWMNQLAGEQANMIDALRYNSLSDVQEGVGSTIYGGYNQETGMWEGGAWSAMGGTVGGANSNVSSYNDPLAGKFVSDGGVIMWTDQYTPEITSTNITEDDGTSQSKSPIHEFFFKTAGLQGGENPEYAFSNNSNWYTKRDNPNTEGVGSSGEEHKGVDIKTYPKDFMTAGKSELHAITAGKITDVRFANQGNPDSPYDTKGDGGWGNSVEFTDAAGYRHRYAHMRDNPTVKIGDTLNGGELLGVIGTTGDSNGEHLHYQINSPDGSSHVNPLTYFKYHQPTGGYNGATQGAVAYEGITQSHDIWSTYQKRYSDKWPGVIQDAYKNSMTPAETATILSTSIWEDGAQKVVGEKSLTATTYDGKGQRADGIMNWVSTDFKGNTVGEQMNYMKRRYFMQTPMDGFEYNGKYRKNSDYQRDINAFKEMTGRDGYKLALDTRYGDNLNQDLIEGSSHFYQLDLAPSKSHTASGLADYVGTAIGAYNWMLQNGYGSMNPSSYQGNGVDQTQIGTGTGTGNEDWTDTEGNKRTIWSYLVNTLGFSKEGAAGAMGNMYAESHYSPYALLNHETDDYSINYAKKVNETGSFPTNDPYGIVQWLGDRRSKLLTHAKSSSASIADLPMQLSFLGNELNGGYKSVNDGMKAATDVKSASDLWQQKFEVCGAATDKRRNAAQEAYNQFKNATNLDISSYQMNAQQQAAVADLNNTLWINTLNKVIHETDLEGLHTYSNGPHSITLDGRQLSGRPDCTGMFKYAIDYLGYDTDNIQSHALVNSASANEHPIKKDGQPSEDFTSIKYDSVGKENLRPGDIVVRPGHGEVAYGMVGSELRGWNFGFDDDIERSQKAAERMLNGETVQSVMEGDNIPVFRNTSYSYVVRPSGQLAVPVAGAASTTGGTTGTGIAGGVGMNIGKFNTAMNSTSGRYGQTGMYRNSYSKTSSFGNYAFGAMGGYANFINPTSVGAGSAYTGNTGATSTMISGVGTLPPGKGINITGITQTAAPNSSEVSGMSSSGLATQMNVPAGQKDRKRNRPGRPTKVTWRTWADDGGSTDPEVLVGDGCWGAPDRQCSVNYGISDNGVIKQDIDEGYGAWTTSSESNDKQAVTLEIGNSKGAMSMGEEWPISDAAMQSAINLTYDIAKRNGIQQFVFTRKNPKPYNNGDGADGSWTYHRTFADKSCPGDYIYDRTNDILNVINGALANNGATAQNSSLAQNISNVTASGDEIPNVDISKINALSETSDMNYDTPIDIIDESPKQNTTNIIVNKVESSQDTMMERILDHTFNVRAIQVEELLTKIIDKMDEITTKKEQTNAGNTNQRQPSLFPNNDIPKQIQRLAKG